MIGVLESQSVLARFRNSHAFVKLFDENVSVDGGDALLDTDYSK